LLSILNVKYAITVNPVLYFNGGTGSANGEARPADVEIRQNPLPIAPREFFAAEVVPVPPRSRASHPTALAPPELNVATASRSAVMLSWRAVIPDAVYRVERRTGADSGYREVGVTQRDGRSMYNPGLAPNTLYRFRVRACVGRECSPYSQEISVVTPDGRTAAPVALTARAVSHDRVDLEWSGGSAGVVYHVEAKVGRDGAYREIAVTAPDVAEHSAKGLAPLTSHVFRVRACVIGGCSEYSAEASADTPSSLSAAELRGVIPADVERESAAEGFPALASFATDGTIRTRYEGSRVEVEVDPSREPRFLVLNELYHPRWKAFADGRELRIYPTNVVMRGLVVPPGTTRIELRFVPFFLTPSAGVLFLGGLVLVGAGWLLLRRKDIAA